MSATVPVVPDPNNWNNAYTINNGHSDSMKRIGSISIMVSCGFLVAFIYLFIYLFRIRDNYIVTHSQIGYLFLVLLVVLLPILMLIVGISIYGAFTKAFLTELCNPPESIPIDQIIQYRLLGVPALPPPLSMLWRFKSMNINGGNFERNDKWEFWMAKYLGGPLRVTVNDGFALYLERGNRFSRIIGPGKVPPFLEIHEVIKYVIDYRSTVNDEQIRTWTKDGINIKLNIRMGCKIGGHDAPPIDSTLIYPFHPESIKKAVEKMAVRYNKEGNELVEVDWIGATWGQVNSILPKYIGGRTINDLFIADQQGGQILSTETLTAILEEINNRTNGFGVIVTDLQITSFSMPKDIEEQLQSNWYAEIESKAKIFGGQAKADAIRTREEARAEAQRYLIQAIAESLNQNQSEDYTEALMLSLSGVLSQGLRDSWVRGSLAQETLDTLEKLQNLINKEPSG